ncbi:MFS general substrate transporter [Xylariomycetidae sp. FL2044]|nr:MFS general substrate transporter [Xylariomycetidae sp. FL2044]KAH9903739.1 MFS general substrate transporter [Xylariomycetidae sp. FL2044]
MAFVMAILEMVTAVVSFVGAFPWGLVADRIGRRPVVTLALGGIILCTMWQMLVIYRRDVLPLELLWLGPAGLLVGGGNAIVVGIVLSMMTDATREEERALAFMRAHVASLCGNLISPGLASIMMSRQGPWPCMWLAVALLATAGISFLFVPETVPPRSPERPVEAAVEQPSTFGAKLSHTVSRYRESLSMLKSPSLILLLVTLLLTTPVSVATLQFMTQFVSKRYGIKIYQTGYVQSAYGVVQVLCALVFLPWVSKLLIKGSVPARFRASNEHSRDLTLMRWSHGILIVGALVLGLSPTLAGFVFGLVLMAIGAGYNSLNRSMMSLYVDPEHRSRLFSLVGMVDVVGAVYSQPMLAALFAVGLRLEGGWIGLPYYVLSAQVAVVLGLLMLVRLPDSKAAQDVPEDEGRD